MSIILEIFFVGLTAIYPRIEVRTDMSDTRPLFTVSNHHVESCGKSPHIDGDIRKRYHGYYENEYGEQAIFVYDYEVNEGTLWMGDAGWEKPYKVVNGTVPELVMGREEMIWLMNCWQTATSMLPKDHE